MLRKLAVARPLLEVRSRLSTTLLRRLALFTILAAAPAAAVSAPASASAPGEGPGGPILVVVDQADPSGRYYAEILHAEGLNEFAVRDVDQISASLLSSYKVVVLAQAGLSAGQASALEDFVQGGGDLIAMRPDDRLAGLLGLGARSATVGDGYLGVDTSSAPGAGITGDTMQFHGTADRWSLSGAQTVATLYRDATTPAGAPAVTVRGVGSNGGHAAAFTYDLAQSVIATRQGNIAWAGEKRDGQINPRRSDDLFFPDWADLDKVQIPQADEQQRLLANLITGTSADQLPLPRFWYFPRGLKAVVVMTGDDHANGGTQGQMEGFEAASPPGCSVADWECVRSTSYIWPNTPISNARVKQLEDDGFEISLHLNPASGPPAQNNCGDFTLSSLRSFWNAQLPAFTSEWPSADAPVTNRNHCVAWSDWSTQPKVELENGVRLDTTYYYWPGAWVGNRPGMFTGSGMPMRFAGVDGFPLDVYQAATQITDESGMDIPLHVASLLNNALGSPGYYGAFTANMHTDTSQHAGADAIVEAARDRGVPVVSAKQLLTWTDGRDGSSFGDVSFSAGRLAFTVSKASGARNLMAMLPVSGGGGTLTGLTRDGAAVAFTKQTIKGIEYAFFDAAGGSYAAQYGSGGGSAPPDTTPPVTTPPDTTPPDTTITKASIDESTAHFTFAASETGAHFQCRMDDATFTSCTSPATYKGLDQGRHTFAVRAVDAAGNPDASPATKTFTSTGRPPEATTTTAPAGGRTSGEGGAPWVTVKSHRLRASRSGVVTLAVRCPAYEEDCTLYTRLRVGGRAVTRLKKAEVAGGRTAKVRLELSRATRKRLRRSGSLKAVAVVTVTDVDLNTIVSKPRLRLLAPHG
jgi:ABC-type sugar transport system substrate-binding protein